MEARWGVVISRPLPHPPCAEVPDKTPWRWITEVDRGVAVGAATDERRGPSDSAVTLHKSQRGQRPLKTEPAHCLLSRETQRRISGGEISV